MPKDHLVQLRAVFKKLKEAGLKLKSSKCAFFKKSPTYLGHRILEGDIKTDDSTIKVICEWFYSGPQSYYIHLYGPIR